MGPLEPTDPRVVGRYRLEGRLGAGGFGDVFLGRSPGGRPVAVKCIREVAADPQLRRRFAAEMDAARRVGGFHTAQVVDADADATPPYMVTAYIPGPTLTQVVAEHGRLPEPSLRVLGAGLAEALEAIHAAGLIHRDLKPSNVLIADDGPRVIDFGIARAVEGTALTASGSVPGTPAFMAPEQARGLALTPACDVFNLGLVLCHAAGSAPFGAGSAIAVMYRVVNEEPDVSSLPAALRGPVAACLAKDPGLRPTPAELLAIFGGGAPQVSWLPPEIQTTVSRPAPLDGQTAPTGPHQPSPLPYPRRLPATPYPNQSPATPYLNQPPATPHLPPMVRDVPPARGGFGAGIVAVLVAAVLGLAAVTAVTVQAVYGTFSEVYGTFSERVAAAGGTGPVAAPTGSATGGRPIASAQPAAAPTGSATKGRSTTPKGPAATTGTWSARDNGLPVTVTVVKVVNDDGKVSLTVRVRNDATESVTLSAFNNFSAIDDRGTGYTADRATPITVPVDGTVSATITLDQTVSASARQLTIAWADVFSLDFAVSGSISVKGIPLPR